MSPSWGQNYSPNEMLQYASVDVFEYGQKTDNLIRDLLALFALERDPETLIEKMKELLWSYGRVSIGQALSKLSSVAKTGPELDYNRDGLDCLTYHLGGSSCLRNCLDIRMVTPFLRLKKSKLRTNSPVE